MGFLHRARAEGLIDGFAAVRAIDPHRAVWFARGLGNPGGGAGQGAGWAASLQILATVVMLRFISRAIAGSE